MRFLVALTRLLTILAVVGVVMGAATAPVGAGSGSMPGMPMTSDMPDCSGDSADCDDATSCPYMVACVGKIAQVLPGVAPVEAPLSLTVAVPLRDDRERASRAIPPPPRPPEA